MTTGAPPQPAVVHQTVFEVRYNYGHTYLDRCGITMNDLLRKNIGWSVDGANPQSGTLHNAEKAATFSFGSEKLSMSFKQGTDCPVLPDMAEIANLSATFTMDVLDHLAIEEVTRMGFRTWQLFGYDELVASQEAVKSLGFVANDRIEGLGVTDLQEVSLNFVAARGDYEVRVASRPGMRTRPHTSPALMELVPSVFVSKVNTRRPVW